MCIFYYIANTPHRQSIHYSKSSKLTFKVIAKRLGFGSASYFTRFIRQHTGKTPREMREREAEEIAGQK